ncbi:hypothetical protein [Microbacterium amylolyticum]|uniref:6-phosphogluconate dehydrogenase (Decarboxylating) n=1 Tax=Microbacterium amylolyticum TaxID=936337 RepID=A0ABS4ZGX2_9MICO|nr:hypothetical protein [Microbacterium amylolyticum]MBP2436539.1 6-phosphogluconate dehydrogenase (decarboxylating) [Microbacterium amylolyticum]
MKADIDPREAALTSLAMTEGLEVMWLNGFDIDMVAISRVHLQRYLTTPL